MFAAPPVHIHVVPDRLGRGFALVCASLAAANLTAWCLTWADGPAALRAVVVTLAAGVAALLTWRLLARRADAAGELVWDGGVWHWMSEAAQSRQGQVQVMIDLGPWMLLRFCPPAPARRGVWLATSRRDAVGQWPAWRAALYAPGADTPNPLGTGPT